MKKLIVLSFFIPVFAKAQFVLTNTSTVSLMDPRTGKWPLDLQRVVKNSDTTYLLAFRDQTETEEVNMSTLKFGDLSQLKFFMQALAALKTNSTGTQATFKDYFIKRMDVKKDGTKGIGTIWYILQCTDGSTTNFEQPEADKMIAAIKSL
jgi:hypothetical protein